MISSGDDDSGKVVACSLLLGSLGQMDQIYFNVNILP
jgi:hypothetical protein